MRPDEPDDASSVRHDETVPTAWTAVTQAPDEPRRNVNTPEGVIDSARDVARGLGARRVTAAIFGGGIVLMALVLLGALTGR